MIRHCVFIRFNAQTTKPEREAIFAAVHALKGIIPGIVEIRTGTNNSSEGLDKGFSDGFIVDFENAAARDRYLSDPDHAKVGARIVAAAEGGLEGLLVFDLDWRGTSA